MWIERGVVLVVASTLGTTFIPGIAFAQASLGPAQDVAGTAEGGGASGDDSSMDGNSVGEIVVTAQRRSEKLRDVPISITAMTGDQLQQQGITDSMALTTTTPGLKMDKVGGFAVPAIRGISTAYTAPGGDINVAIYLDGIYQASSNSNTFDLPDVERVEVLKGPQGTLFGRNATGGAIQIITREPSYTLSGSLTASYGNLDDKILKGFVSVPIIDDHIALSIAGYYRHNDGYNIDLVTGDKVSPLKSHLVRSKLLLEPSDAIKVILTGFYSKRSDASTAYGYALNGNTIGNLFPGSVISSAPYRVASSQRMKGYIESYGFSGRIEAELGSGKVTALSGYTHNVVVQPADTDFGFNPGSFGVYYDTRAQDKAFSQEINYAILLSDRVNLVIGGFFIDGYGGYLPLSVLSDSNKVTIRGKQSFRAYAGFGEIYFDLTERFHFIGGMRYSSEKRSLRNGAGGYGTTPVLHYIGERSWNSLTPRATAKYDLTPASNVYVSYSKGFKSGVFNTTATTLQSDGSLPLANPEKVEAYEIGYKGRVTSGLDVTAAAFLYNYSDVQVTAYTCVPAGSPNCLPLSILQNAASARIKGIDLDATLRLGAHFSLRTGISVLDAKYSDFPNAQVSIPKTDANGVPTNTGNLSVPFDATGYQMIRAPKFTITATPTYTTQLGGGKFQALATIYHTSSFPYTFNGRIRQKSYETIDARLSWSPNNSGLTFAVFGRNLTDEDTILATFISDSSDGLSAAPPRTYGAEVSFKF